jgi:hypothetical protein
MDRHGIGRRRKVVLQIFHKLELSEGLSSKRDAEFILILHSRGKRTATGGPALNSLKLPGACLQKWSSRMRSTLGIRSRDPDFPFTLWPSPLRIWGYNGYGNGSFALTTCQRSTEPVSGGALFA